MNTSSPTLVARHGERGGQSSPPPEASVSLADTDRVDVRRPRRDPRHPFTFDSPVHDSGLVPLQGIHVMLVEDNVDARNIVRRVLEHCGALVTVAETAKAALRRLRAMPGRPHVLVSDIALPGQDGYWLIRQVRSLARLAGVPAIAITAHRNEYEREETLAVGFQDYFQKPLDLVAFCSAISRLGRVEPS
jgi:CheY-like chemotaxis protein